MISVLKKRVKPLVQACPSIERLYIYLLGWEHQQIIRREQRLYDRIARDQGLYELSDKEIKDAIQRRIRKREIYIEQKKGRSLHVLYASHFGNWEMHQIPSALEHFGKVTLYSLPERGFDHERKDWLNVRHLLDEDFLRFVKELHAREPVDLFIGYLNGLQVSSETILSIGKLGIITVMFNFDDRLLYRGHKLGNRWTGSAAHAAAYDLNLTNSSNSVIKYMADGGLAKFWPSGANPEFFKPLDIPFEYDVSFIGANYGARSSYINYLRRHDIQVETFGYGWPNGIVTEEEMIGIYAKSRINLGFSWVGATQTETCLKGRDFEVPMCGVLYLTTEQPDLHRVYDVGSEVISYKDKYDCLRKIKYYLNDEEESHNIRLKARTRSVKYHSWVRRFGDLFNILGLQ